MELSSANELPSLYSIINKTFKIGKNKVIKFDFGLEKETFINFKIIDSSISSGYEKSSLDLTAKSLQHVIDILESALADIKLAGGYCMGDSRLDNGNKTNNYEIICEYFNLSHKKYLDCRLWRWLNDFDRAPTKRGFRIDINEISDVIQNLKDAKTHFRFWKGDIHRHINYAISVIKNVIKKDKALKFHFEHDCDIQKKCSTNVLQNIFSKSLSDVEEEEEPTQESSSSKKTKLQEEEEEADNDGFPTFDQLKEIEFYDMLVSFDKNVFINEYKSFAIPNIDLSTVFHFIIENKQVTVNSIF